VLLIFVDREVYSRKRHDSILAVAAGCLWQRCYFWVVDWGRPIIGAAEQATSMTASDSSSETLGMTFAEMTHSGRSIRCTASCNIFGQRVLTLFSCCCLVYFLTGNSIERPLLFRDVPSCCSWDRKVFHYLLRPVARAWTPSTVANPVPYRWHQVTIVSFSISCNLVDDSQIILLKSLVKSADQSMTCCRFV